MKFETNKEKGNTGLAMAIAYFGINGYTISIPLNDTQDYDLIVDKDNILQKVQVKATGQRTKSGTTMVSVRSSGGNGCKVYKTVGSTDIDILFVVNEEKDIWVIPKEKMEYAVNCICLGKKFEEYKTSI